MRPPRSSSLSALDSGSYWLLQATTNSTTIVTSEYLGLPQAKHGSRMSISSLEEGDQADGLIPGQAQAMLTLTLRGTTGAWPIHSWPEHPPRTQAHPGHSGDERGLRLLFCEILSFSRKLNSEAGLQKLQHMLNV